MPSLKLTFFGSPQIELNGTPVQLPTRKALALLAYVAVTNQVQSRETLATLFWPEFSSERAFANLREALRLLKQLLTDHWLTIQRYDVALRADAALWVDVHEFQRHLDQADHHVHAPDIACADCLPALMTAIDLYQDDFLHGFTLPDSPGFDEWQAFQTELFREKLIASFTRIIHYATASEQYARAVQYARQWIRQCSWSEAAHRELMRLYALNRQRSAALQQYQDCARMLQEEFGAEPEQQTTELYEAILHQIQPSNGWTESLRTLKRPLKAGYHENLAPEGASASLNSQTGGLAPGSGESAMPSHNLPAQTTSFIGRETEIAAVKQLLLQPNVRLVTLTGAGGSGKTRLGLRVAADVVEAFPDGVFFVPLAPVSDVDLVSATIVQVLEIPVVGNTPPLKVLEAYLNQKQILLVLDNFEQILEAAPTLIELLSAAPDLKILVTSRTVLSVSGEHEYLVPPLNVPAPEDVLSFRDSTQAEAVQLFVERARAVNLEFTLTEENAPSVAGICIRLDGLPLGIELAAARLRMFSPQRLLARLSSPLQFLTGGLRDRPARQQTLRNAIVWSHDLLNEAEQILFRRVAVFVGGWSLDAAEQICAIDGDLDVLTGLEALVNHHLLTRDTLQGNSRFTMLETIREYALEQFAGNKEAEIIRKQHTRFFVTFAEEANTHLNRLPIEEHVRWKAQLTQEMDNLRAALAWALANAEEWRQTAIHMHETLADVLELTGGQHAEACQLYRQTLCEVPKHDIIWQARLHRKIGKTYVVQYQFAEALEAYDRAQALLGSEPTEAAVEWWQEWVEIRNDFMYAYYHHGRSDELNALATQVRPIVERYGTAVQRTKFFYSLLRSAYRRERYQFSEDTVALGRAALATSLETDDLNLITDSQFAMGFNYLWSDQLEHAEKTLQAALTLGQQMGNILVTTQCLTYLTILYRRLGRIDTVRDYVSRSFEAAKSAQLSSYISVSHANLAWLAWHDGDLSATKIQAHNALEHCHPSHPFKSLSLWPLIGAALVQNRTSEALEHARVLLAPEQKRLPDALTAALEKALQTWDAGDEERARNQLTQAMELAQELQHF